MKLNYQTLENVSIPEIYEAFIASFSRYQLPKNINLDSFTNNILRQGFHKDLSFGAFSEGQLTGFLLVGTGQWKGEYTAYDIGTGVLPEYKGRNIDTRMLKRHLPVLKSAGIQQYLLEVIERNKAAVTRYQNDGFQVSRSFRSYALDPYLHNINETLDHISIQELPKDPQVFAHLLEIEPSWQNSHQALARSPEKLLVLGAFIDETLVGYAMVVPSTGDVPQFAVSSQSRGQGVGRALVLAMLQRSEEELRFINIDSRSAKDGAFFEKIGCTPLPLQYEMVYKF